MDRFFVDFGSNCETLKPLKSLKNQWFFNDFGIFAGYCFHCSWKPPWLHFGSILDVKLGPKSIKNRLQTHSNNLSKNDCILDRSWDGFWSIFGSKMRPSWYQNAVQEAFENNFAQKNKKCHTYGTFGGSELPR